MLSAMFVIVVAVAGDRQIDFRQFGPGQGYEPTVTVTERIESDWQLPALIVFEGTLGSRRHQENWLVTWNAGLIEATDNGRVLDLMVDDTDPYRISWTWLNDQGVEKRGFLLAGPENTLVLQLGDDRLLLASDDNDATIVRAQNSCRCFGKRNPIGACTDEDCDQGRKCTPANPDRSCRWSSPRVVGSNNNQHYRP